MKKITLLAALLVAGITTANAQVNVETPKLSANVGTTPVSYTHLDVYKRQT